MADTSSHPTWEPSRRLYPNTPPEGVDQDGIYCEQPLPDTPLNDGPEFPWPAEKFGMRHNDLFETLAPRFNMCSVPIQSPANFALDVQYAAEMASTPQELYDALGERRSLARRRLERGFDRALDVFIERQLPSLTTRQYMTMIALLQSRTLSSVLDVAWASMRDDASGGTTRSSTSPAIDLLPEKYLDEHPDEFTDEYRHPTPGLAETLPPSQPPAYSSEYLAPSRASPAPSADSSLPDTLPPYPDSSFSVESQPGSPPKTPPPGDSPYAERAGDDADDSETSLLPTTPSSGHPTTPKLYATDDRTLSRASSNTAASPATPTDFQTTLDAPGSPPGINIKGPAVEPFVLPPFPQSRKRRRVHDDAGDDEAASSPRQPKSAKR